MEKEIKEFLKYKLTQQKKGLKPIKFTEWINKKK